MRAITRHYLGAMAWKPCGTFEHVVWAFNNKVSRDNILHTKNITFLYCTQLYLKPKYIDK